MGAIFSPPDPAPPQLPTLEQPDPNEESRKARLEALKRRRRGRGGTIRTSVRGVLQPRTSASTTKNRLGE